MSRLSQAARNGALAAIGLYLIDGVLTVAMAQPDNEETVRRLRQIVVVQRALHRRQRRRQLFQRQPDHMLGRCLAQFGHDFRDAAAVHADRL